MAELPRKPQPTADAIDAHYVANQGSGYRDHIGASMIGNECERAIWYSWRWATQARHAGRLLRLFERGQLEEDRFVKMLRTAGVQVLSVNPDDGKQWSFRDASGHFGGSMDGVGLGFLEAPKTWAGIEMKTHSAKSFASLVKDGCAKSKPTHWAQMHVYGELAGLERFFYIAVNKDNDELYTEWVHIDRGLSLRLIAKAHRIIAASNPPTRLSSDPSFFVCKWCDHHAVCHKGKLPDSHCRSCLHSAPAEDGEWTCVQRNATIDATQQRKGCIRHLYLPSLVDGEQTDAGEDYVEYKMRDGSVWRDTELPF